MSRDPYRSSTGDLYRNVQRWDAERFTEERDRRGSGSVYEDDRVRERVYYDDREREFARESPVPRRPRGQSITIERRERERVYSPSPPRRAPARPSFLRRQSSLDTFDRKPYRREEYGPPARREDFRPAAYAPIPLPRARALPPPRVEDRYYEDIKISENERYGDEIYRGYPERIREREVVRSRPARHSRSRSRSSRTRRSSVSSFSSESSATTTTTIKERKSEFPKRGKTRMPGRLVSKKAIIDLGYPFEEEGDLIIILKALGPENIDEVIKLSEDYKKVEISGGQSESVEERRSETIRESEDGRGDERESVEKSSSTTLVIRNASPSRSHRSHSLGPSRRYEEPREVVERSNDISLGPLVLTASPSTRQREERDMRMEIKLLEAEKSSIREERVEEGEVVVVQKRRRGRESVDNGVRVYKDKKGPNPRAVATLLKTLT